MQQKIENAATIKKVANILSNNIKKSTMPLKYIKNENGEFVCPHPGCGFTKRNQSTLHYHMKKHEEQLEHVCKVCKKQFLQKQTLELHIRSKHPEIIKDSSTAEKKFKCPYDDCNFAALTKGNCIIHCLRIHFQEEINKILVKDEETKIIHCNECKKEFSSSCSFYYHCKGCITFNKTDAKYKKFEEICS
jgi:hypothetical protein